MNKPRKKLSRKERKVRADKKRTIYLEKIADHACKMAENFNKKTFVWELEGYICLLIKQTPHDAHLIRQAGQEYSRKFLAALKLKKEEDSCISED